MTGYPLVLNVLIEELKKFPGVGPKTAERLAFFILKSPRQEAENLAQAIREAKQKLSFCPFCFSITESENCLICSDQRRNQETICIVEEPQHIQIIEKTGQHQGLYHVLLGVLSPLDGIGPEDLKIRELLLRLKNGIKEVILATNPSVEGEATAHYLAQLLKPLGLKVTRLARGLPAGGSIDYADEQTLTKALEGRTEL